jgi:Ca-activated chloride channel family protein
MPISKKLKVIAATVLTTALLAGCSATADNIKTSDTAIKDGPNVLRVLAGSEVKDMEPIIKDVEKNTGVKVEFEYTGTLDGTELVASGGAKDKYDATWFPSNRYLALLNGGSAAIKHEEKIMSSPVVLGVKPAVAARLGWDKKSPTWTDIVTAVNEGELKYGMTSPVSSNSGFSALIEAATALSGTGSVLTSADITKVSPTLKQLFKGQNLTAGSSGWLADSFVAKPGATDTIFNYESVLKSLKVDGKPLDIIVPSDGVITADYPLTLLSSASSAKEKLYDKVTKYLETDAVQTKIHSVTQRRTSTSAQSSATVFELPFPNQLDTVQSLISTYLSEIKKPSDMVFTIDTSGSMGGQRITDLKSALNSLTDVKQDKNGFVAFQSRETINYVEFSSAVKSDKTFAITEKNRDKDLESIQSYIDNLSASGGTAIYDSLEKSYENALKLKAANPDHFVSVTLFTDGENTDGAGYADFEKFYKKQVSADTGIQTIPTYVIIFGDANGDELTKLGALTNGKAFSASDGSKLPSIFKEIRGYQ